MQLRTALLLTLGALGVFAPGRADAQTNALNATDLTRADSLGDERFGFRNGSVVVVPIPRADPTLGNGLILGAGYLFQFDEGSDTSYFGLGALRTDNGSEAVGGGVNLSFGDGRWSLALAYGRADVNYEIDLLSGLDFGDLPINQTGEIASAELTYGLSEAVFLGVSARWLRTRVALRDEESSVLPPVLGRFGVEAEAVQIGPVLSWNTVDDSIYPTSGQDISLSALRGIGLEGFDAEFWRTTFDTRAYVPIGARNVLATRATFCSVDGDAPFYDQCGIGITDGFRGYAVGRFFDDALASAQAEWRVQATPRLGAAVFAGAGTVARSFDAMTADDILTAGGLALRYRVSKEFGLDLAVDATINGDGEQTTYVYVGQAF